MSIIGYDKRRITGGTHLTRPIYAKWCLLKGTQCYPNTGCPPTSAVDNSCNYETHLPLKDYSY